jgi:hypothetical protein
MPRRAPQAGRGRHAGGRRRANRLAAQRRSTPAPCERVAGGERGPRWAQRRRGARAQEGSLVEKHAVLAPGTVLPPGRLIPGGQLWAGNPARYVRDLTKDEARTRGRADLPSLDSLQKHTVRRCRDVHEGIIAEHQLLSMVLKFGRCERACHRNTCIGGGGMPRHPGHPGLHATPGDGTRRPCHRAHRPCDKEL